MSPTTTPIAFHGDPAIKAKYLTRIAAHRAAEQLTQGVGFDPETNKGCAIGCTLDAYDHERYPIELGIPIGLAYTEDHIFERLSPSAANAWPERFLSAIPIGADLSKAFHRLLLWAVEHDTPNQEWTEECQLHADLIGLLNRYVAGSNPPSDAEWRAHEEDAWAAWAAWAAWDARAAWAARDAWAARAAWDAWAAWAARAARDAWGAWAAWGAYYPRLADALIHILETSPVPVGAGQ